MNRMRPGVRSEKFVVPGDPLAEVGGESVIDRAAVGVVGVHVAERHAAGVGRYRVAGRVESRQAMKYGLRLGQTAKRIASGVIAGRDGGIQTSGTEEVHQSGIHVRERAGRR